MAHRHDHHAPGWGPRPAWPAAPTGLRIGNAERTEVANSLVRHMAEGRLTEDELEERLNVANAAKTAEDLRPLLADLPPLEGPPAPTAPRRSRPRLWWVAVIAVAVAAIGWAGRWAHAGGPVPLGFFPPFPLVVLGVVIFLAWRRHHHHGRRHPSPPRWRHDSVTLP